MQDQVQYGKTCIAYNLDFVERKTLGIKVHPDKTVHVSAPLDTSLEKVKEKVRSKADWIIRQQAFFLSFEPLTPARRYVSGESHLYLGKQYKLKVREDKSESVRLRGGVMEVFTKDKSDNKKVERLLKNWYRAKAKQHFEQLFQLARPLAARFSDVEPYLEHRWMDKRWGSCSRDGKILLNLELIKAPKKCIHYVIVHELCHLAHPNHSRAFWELLEKQIPDWRGVKVRLEHLMV